MSDTPYESTDVTNPPAPIADPRTVHVMGERVAVLETRLIALKEDTAKISTNLHGVANEMQRFVAVEMQCAAKLAQILDAIKDLPTVVAAVATFSNMHPDLREVLKEREQSLGLSAFGRRFAMIVGAAVAVATLLGLIGGGLVWLAQHLKPL